MRRCFAPDPVPDEVVDNALAVAASAPSGANLQPWRFVIVRDREVRRRIRAAAEAEERESYEGRERRAKHYYVSESVGIACGMLLAALHWSGLATLTHTPSPMGFLSSVLERPANEKPYLLVPVGYPADGAVVPRIVKKPMHGVRIDV